MTEPSEQALARISAEINSTPFESLPNVDLEIVRVLAELMPEDMIRGLAGALGITDVAQLTRDVYLDVLDVMLETPGFWVQIQVFVKTRMIMERWIHGQ